MKSKFKPHRVVGSPSMISEYIYNDIQLVKQDIKSLNERTKIFQYSPLYYKIYKFIEANQLKELNNLKSKYEYKFTTDYFRSLVNLYKKFVEELDNYLKIMENNYHNGIVESHVQTKSQQHNRGVYGEAPDDLLDPLSLEIFNDPVIAPSGITYEKAIIIDHLLKNGQFDPLTRQELHPNQLYPNLAVKNSAQKFIEEMK